MITTKGKLFFKNYLGGRTSQVIGAASFGIGATTAQVADERLQFEFYRTPILVTAFDPVTNKLTFKGTLPQEVGGTIYEVGLWTAESSVLSVASQPRIITTFDSESEEWDVETFSTTARIGADSLQHTPAASATQTTTMGGLSLDFYDNTANETFVLAYNPSNAFTGSIKVRFMTNASNYYEGTITSPTTGYKFASFVKGAMTVVGTPDWGDITAIQIATTATGAGSANVLFDGLRIEDNDVVNFDYGLVARLIPGTPVVKPVGQTLDFEYTLVVTA